MAGFWKRWLTRHANALSFWVVLTMVALVVVLAAWLLVPAASGPRPAQPPSPARPSP